MSGTGSEEFDVLGGIVATVVGRKERIVLR